MALHHQTAELLALMASFDLPPVEEQTPEEARAQRAAMLRPSPEPIAECRDLDAGGVPVRFYRPAATRSGGLLVWLHGGGWVLGDLDSHDDPCRSLANRGGFCVLSVGYRLAPEHPFPAALDDAMTATRWAWDHAGELGCRQVVAVGGDSAGGNLAAVVANRPPNPLCFQLLVYPATDMRMGHASIEENADGYFLTAKGMRWFYDHYLSGDEGTPEDPRVSPLLEDSERLAVTPPALVITAQYDPLRDEGTEYAARLADAGVPTSHLRVDGQIHGFFSMFGLLDDARSAQAFAAEAVATAFAAAAESAESAG
jgi:acetyl esterase